MPTINERYYQLHPKSLALHQRARDLFPDGVTHDVRYATPFPIYATHGMGPRKWDVDGNEYVDYVMGHGALLLGHSHPAIVAAVAYQVGRGTHLGASHETEIRWAEWVRKLIPSAQKVRFTSSGTESTLMAMRLARAYTGKSKIMRFREHFHGWQDYAAVSPHDLAPGIPAALMGTVVVLEPNNIRLVEETLRADKDIAAIILEPTGAHMGLLPVYPSFLGELREAATRHGVVLIFDEVVTGFRTSPGGAQARYGVTPDLTTLAKILGGGLPAGAVAGKADILDMIQHRGNASGNAERRVSHPGTFNANPLSAAAGATALELVATSDVNARAEAAAQLLKDGLNDLLARMEVPGCASGVGALVSLTLGTPHECDGGVCKLSHQQIEAAVSPLQAAALKRSLQNAGVDPMSGRGLILSATHRKDDVDFTLGAFEEALTAVRREGML